MLNLLFEAAGVSPAINEFKGVLGPCGFGKYSGTPDICCSKLSDSAADFSAVPTHCDKEECTDVSLLFNADFGAVLVEVVGFFFGFVADPSVLDTLSCLARFFSLGFFSGSATGTGLTPN